MADPDGRHPSQAMDTEIAIIGAGLSGLGMAKTLRADGIDDFLVLERASDLGGTWRDNRYPGCACDIPSVLYCYRDEPKSDWTRAYAPQAEIWDYIRSVVARHDLERFIRFEHELTRAAFDEERGRWELEARGPSGEAHRLTAAVLVSGCGALADPVIPALPGLESFSGTVFHSARWNHDQPLDGRKVAVIGTGASAIQFVPEIQPRVDRLTLFQRTPPWVLPHTNPDIPAAWREHLARRPRLLALARAAVFSAQEALHVAFQHPRLARVIEHQGRSNIRRHIADPELRARVTPDFRLGCKRILRSNTWYPALAQDNVEVVSDGIREVRADGIVDGQGVRHEADTIILATGFHVTDPPIAERIEGRDGRILADVWAGSPRTHLGMSVAGFPNLFFLLGPNTGLGHNSVLLMIEAQISYLRRVLAHRASIRAAAVEPTPQAQAASVAEVDRGTKGSVWTAGGCTSWYLDRTGRNSALWPGSVRDYQARLRRFDPAEYTWTRPRETPIAADAEPALA
jgi:cation diffusion facilitator CzcD-associated flavoprotein CzcO